MASACCLGVAAMPATAAPLPAGVSDTLTVFDPAGNVFAQAIATEDDEVANGGGFIYIIPNAGLINPAQFGNATTIYENQADPNTLSDIFGIANGVAGCQDATGLCLAFSSDIDGVPLPFGPFPINLYEGDGIFDATYLLNGELIALGYTAQFQSDSEIPEPASLALLGLGLVGLAAQRRKSQVQG